MTVRDLMNKAKIILVENIVFIIVLIIGLIVWNYVWNLAVVDYLDSGFWNSRHVWLGPGVDPGQFTLFGLTIEYQFEGYSDYSFFYVHWGYNILYGVLPYTPEFGYLSMDGIVNQNGVYLFPPLTALLYGLGILISPDNTGIGLLFTVFGYLTVFPVYGIARHLSNNRRYGEAAALTYILNPMMLYYIAFLWMNPAPFIFFIFSGIYMLMRGRRHTGTLLIVIAALFKQMAWFVGLPLIVYLLLKPRDSSERNTKEKGLLIRLLGYFDFKGFFGSVILVVLFVAAIALPFFLFQPHMIQFMSLAAGGFALESPTEPPGYASPMRLQILPVVAGLPDLAILLDYLVFYSVLLWFGVTLIVGLYAIIPKHENRMYFRRFMLIVLVLLLWVHITGPRGVYKYYFTLFAPFFSILATPAIIRSSNETLRLSPIAFVTPFFFSAMIMVPPRLVYLANVIFILIIYVLIATVKKPKSEGREIEMDASTADDLRVLNRIRTRFFTLMTRPSLSKGRGK